MQNIRVLILGVLFGIILVKSEVISWFRIQAMFKFEEAYMYLIILSAIVVGAISLFIIRKINARTVDNEEIIIIEKQYSKGTILGGIIFGLGWAVTGACPGPIYAQIGSGTYLALITFLGAFSGAYFFAILQPRLPA